MKKGTVYFGYEEFKYEKDPVIINLNDKTEIIGCYGMSGWVVDSIGFVLRETHDE